MAVDRTHGAMRGRMALLDKIKDSHIKGRSVERVRDMVRKQANIKKSFKEGFTREDVIDALVEGIISGTIKAPFKVAASLTGADIPIEMYKASKAIGGAIKSRMGK